METYIIKNKIRFGLFFLLIYMYYLFLSVWYFAINLSDSESNKNNWRNFTFKALLNNICFRSMHENKKKIQT